MSDLLRQPPLPARRRRLRILLGVVMIALTVVVAGLFFARRQIGNRLVRGLGERLASVGVFISWQSADWVPGPGIRLRGLAVYRDAAKLDRLALFGIVTAIKGDPAWHRWDKVNIKTADTQLLLGSGAGETRLEHMDMLLLIQPGKTDLRECHASAQGLRVEAKAAFVHASAAGEAAADGASKQTTQSKGLFRDVNLDWLKSVKEWLQFQPEKDEPVLRMEFNPSPGDRGLSFTMAFDGSRFQWRGQKWDFVQAAAKFPIGTEKLPIEFDHVHIGHGGREAEIAAAFDPTGRVIRISKLDSGIDALALARALMPDAVGSLSAASTSGAWRISGAGEIPLDRPENFRWNGDAVLDGDFVHASGEANVALRKPTFSVRVEEQVVSISDLKAGLWEGSLDAPKTLVYLPSAKKKLRFETQLTLDGARSQSIIDSFSEARKKPGVFPLNWKGAWRINAAGEFPEDHPERFHWNGDAALDGDIFYTSGETNIALRKPAFSVRVEEQVVSVSDFKAGIWEGSLDAPRTLVYLPSAKKGLRFETQLTLNGARSQSIIDSFSEGRKRPGVFPLNWKGAWRISGAGEIPLDRPENFRCNGDVALDGDFTYASGETNIALRKPTFSVRVEEQMVSVSGFKAGLWEGSLDAPKTLVYLPSAKKNLRFETQLTIDGARAQSVRKSFSAGRKQPAVVPLNWKGAWRINAAGEIPADHPENFRWNGDAALDGDLVYASGEANVALRKPAFSVRMEEQVVSISDFKAGLWEGSLDAPRTLLYLPSAKKKLRFETQLTLKGARMQSITSSFGNAQTEPGVVQCDWTGGGEFEPASVAGSGTLSIGEAEFYRMPILGPLHLVFARLTPQFRKDVPSTMTVNHRMAGGILYLEDLKLVSDQVHIEAGGTIDLAREYAQFTATGRLRKIPGLATVLLTSLLELKGEGPVDNVQWGLKSIPGVNLIGKTAKKTTRAAAEAVKGAGRAVKGLIELPGRLLPDK